MVLGMSYGQVLLLMGATAALVGPKDLPRIARSVGRLAGRSKGYFELIRTQFEHIINQAPAGQIKEMHESMAQFDAICHEVQNVSNINPLHLTRRLMNNRLASHVGDIVLEKREEKQPLIKHFTKDYRVNVSGSTNLQSQATTYTKFAEVTLNSGSMNSNDIEKLKEEVDSITVLPISAELARMLPNRKESPQGSDLILEAIIEAQVARDAKDFFSKPENQISPQ